MLIFNFPGEIPFDDPEMIFTFRSDKGTSKSGFAIKVRQRSECGTTWKPGKLDYINCVKQFSRDYIYKKAIIILTIITFSPA